MRLAVEALVTGPGDIRTRLATAEPHFGRAFDQPMHGPAAEHLRLRIGAGLVEGGDEDCSVAESIAALREQRAMEIAGDMLRLYEVLTHVRTDDGYGFKG